MTAKELIHAEIDNLGEENLAELYGLIKRFVASKSVPGQQGIMSKLRCITIDAPADFATNLDLYMNGEKRVEDQVR